MKMKTDRMMPHDENHDLFDVFKRVNFALPSEIHAADDDWEKYESVNDPATNKKLPDEIHGTDDDWEEYVAVNDPASKKKLANEVHGCVCEERDPLSSPFNLTQEIYVT